MVAFTAAAGVETSSSLSTYHLQNNCNIFPVTTHQYRSNFLSRTGWSEDTNTHCTFSKVQSANGWSSMDLFPLWLTAKEQSLFHFSLGPSPDIRPGLSNRRRTYRNTHHWTNTDTHLFNAQCPAKYTHRLIYLSLCAVAMTCLKGCRVENSVCNSKNKSEILICH